MMNTRCLHCGVQYAIAAPAEGPRTQELTCGQCGHPLEVMTAGEQPAPVPTPNPQPSQQLTAPVPWLVRQLSGSVFAPSNQGTLERWIREGRVSRDDLLSQDGTSWQRLGNIVELAPLFSAHEPPTPAQQSMGLKPATSSPSTSQGTATSLGDPANTRPSGAVGDGGAALNISQLVAQGVLPTAAQLASFDPSQAGAASVQSMPGVQALGAQPPIQVAREPHALRPTSVMPRVAAQPPSPGFFLPHSVSLHDEKPPRTTGPRTTRTRSATDVFDDGPDEPTIFAFPTGAERDDAHAMRSAHRGSRWAFVACLAIGIAAAGTYVTQPPWLNRAISTLRRAPVPHAVVAEVARGYAALDKDSMQSLSLAMDAFTRASRMDYRFADAPAGLAETELAIAEQFNQAADDLSAFAEKQPKRERLRLQNVASEQRDEAARHAQRALTLAKEALALAPESLAANRALALYYGVRGATDKMQQPLKRARATAPNDPRVLYATGLAALSKDPNAARTAWTSAVQADPNFNRALYRLARLDVAQKQTKEAGPRVERILTTASDHVLAQDLLQIVEPTAHTKASAPTVLAFQAPREIPEGKVAPDVANPPATLASNGATPLADAPAVVNQDAGEKVATDKAKPSDDAASTEGKLPSEPSATAQGEPGTKPSDDAAKPDDGAAKPEDVAAKPDDGAAKPEDIAAKADDGAAKSEEIAAKPNDDAAKPEDVAGDTPRVKNDAVEQLKARLKAVAAESSKSEATAQAKSVSTKTDAETQAANAAGSEAEGSADARPTGNASTQPHSVVPPSEFSQAPKATGPATPFVYGDPTRVDAGQGDASVSNGRASPVSHGQPGATAAQKQSTLAAFGSALRQRAATLVAQATASLKQSTQSAMAPAASDANTVQSKASPAAPHVAEAASQQVSSGPSQVASPLDKNAPVTPVSDKLQATVATTAPTFQSGSTTKPQSAPGTPVVSANPWLGQPAGNVGTGRALFGKHAPSELAPPESASALKLASVAKAAAQKGSANSGKAAPAPSAAEQAASVDALLEQARTQHDGHHTAEALALYEAITRRAPSNVSGYIGLGWCQLELNDHAGAKQSFGRAIQIAPRTADAHFGLAEALRSENERRDAVKQYRQYLSIEPGGSMAQLARKEIEDLSK